MKILALETSSQACSVALSIDQTIIEKHQLIANQHSTYLLSFIEQVLHEAAITKSELDAIAVGNGPGSFTGLRLGIGAAQGLAYGLNKPLIPVSSLLSVAAQFDQRHILVAVDARMGEVYWQCFKKQDELEFAELTKPGLNKPSELILPQIEGQWFGVGSGWDEYGDQLVSYLDDSNNHVNGILPKAATVAVLARNLIQQEEVDLTSQVWPVYVRNKVTN